MADRSRSEIIRTKPIGDELNGFRDSFRLTYSLAVPSSSSALDQIGNDGNTGVCVRGWI